MDIEQLRDLFTSIFGDSTVGNGVKALLSIIAIGMLWWYRKQKVKISNEQTAKNRAQAQGAISDKNTKISEDSRKAEDEIEEILNGE